MEHDTLKTCCLDLRVESMLTINTIIQEVRNFNNFKATNRLELACIRIEQGMVVSGVRHKSLHHSRVTFRSEQAVAVTHRDIVLRHLSTSGKETFKDLVAIGSILRNLKARNELESFTSTKNFISTDAIIRNVTVLRGSILSRFISEFVNHGTVSRHSKSFTKLTRVFNTYVIVIHCIINVRNQAVSSQETVNSNHTFIVFHLLTLIVKGVTWCKILSTGTTHNSE